MMSERHYLLKRCLRLEAERYRLEMEIERLRSKLLSVQKRQTSEADRSRMRDLKRRGLSAPQIAQLTGWSEATVYGVTKGVTIEREAA